MWILDSIRVAALRADAAHLPLMIGPVSKELLSTSSSRFPGMTEYLGKIFKHSPIMVFHSAGTFLHLLTRHIAISKIPALIKKRAGSLRMDIGVFLEFLKKRRLSSPVACLGIDPHVGEKGVIGNLDDFLKREIYNHRELVGPFAQDSFYINGKKGVLKYAGIIAPYHDAALAPWKALFGFDSVNITIGLPILRVSPDHGPAYDAVRSGSESFQSFFSCLRFIEKER